MWQLLAWLNSVVIRGLRAGITRRAVLRGSLCVCIVLIYSAAKATSVLNKLTLLLLYFSRHQAFIRHSPHILYQYLPKCILSQEVSKKISK